MRINTNIASLNAQSNNTNTNLKLQESLEKLSSGLKINKAADDASGMAIADKLRTQASSIGQGIANANSASALIQIADAAMGEQSKILDTVKTKLLQAATSTTSEEGREAIRKDVSKLLDQLDNISSQTNYNGVNLLDKKDSEFSFQVGEKSTDIISTTTAYAVNTIGLGAGQELINDEETLMNIVSEAYLDKNGSQLTLKADPDTSLTATTDNRAVSIGDAATGSGTAGLTSYSIKADSVTALTFDNGGGGTITLTTTDAALIAEFDASATVVNTNLDGVYTVATGDDGYIEFASGIDITDLKISNAVMGNAADANDALGVVTDEFVTVEKISGVGRIGMVAAEYDVADDAHVTLQAGRDLIAQGSSSADGIVYLTNGPEVEKGTVAVQYDPQAALAANTVPAVTIDNQSAVSTDEATYTINANEVDKINLLAGVGGEVMLSTNDQNLIAKLDNMAQNNASLSKINSGAYSFKNDLAGVTSNLNFGGFDIKDLTISGQTSAEAITFQTSKAVNVTKQGDETDENHLLLQASTVLTTTGAVTVGSGNLVGAQAEGMQFSDTLAGLKSLDENGLTSSIANEYISIIDNAMTQLNSVRSDFGSTQNQLSAATRNMMTTQVNIKAAESIIRDVDYAAESANFNKQNIISQAGTYAMSQANQVQQNILRLLQ